MEILLNKNRSKVGQEQLQTSWNLTNIDLITKN
jgi:hypothetical protein